MPAWQPRPAASCSSVAAPKAAPSLRRKRFFVSSSDSTPDLESHARYRFDKDNRLLDAASFGRVFEKAKRSRDKWFTVLCRSNDGTPARLGLAISKKNCKKATARNRIKRVVRESFRQHLEQLEGLDIVVMNKPPATDAENKDLFASLDKHWRACEQHKNSRN